MIPYLNLTLLTKLLQCQSITPEDDGAISLLSSYLRKLNFTIIEKTFGEGLEEIKNLYAFITKNTQGKNFCFAGHTDVVPPGNLEDWNYPPFAAITDGDRIFGRGAQDMKGAIVAFVGAVERFLQENHDFGTLSFLITGDEEKLAKYGTEPMIKFLYQEGITIDSVLVGEPVSKTKLADNIKIGARGSATFCITIQGKEGHVAYEGMTRNPARELNNLLSAFHNYPFQFQNNLYSKTSFEVTKIVSDSGAENIVPDKLFLRFNFRYSDDYNYEKLIKVVEGIAQQHLTSYEIKSWSSGDAALWLDQKSSFLEIAKKSIQKSTGHEPEVSTYGGTSDARFIRYYCEALEIGLVGDKAHQIDESVPLIDLEKLAEIYLNLLKDYFN